MFQAFSNAESEGHKSITFDEFFSIMTARSCEKNTRENMKKVFSFFDDEKTGFVSVKNLRRIVK